MTKSIVVLDGNALNPGDLSWSELGALGDCVVYEHTPPELVLERAREADIILTNKTLLTASTIAALPKLKYIGVLATGVNVVDVAAARQRGILVTNVPAYSTPSVVQLTFALLLELTLHVGHHAQTVRDGRWCQSQDFCYWDYPLVELAGLTFGIVGYGRIGRSVATVARAFGMDVLAYNTSPKTDPPTRFTDLESLLAASDVVSLHCPLTAANQGFINAERLALMKPTAYLLNTARGPLIDEQALADALNEGRLAGAGLDVLSQEPPLPDNPLLKAKNCLITPHLAWATYAARQRLMKTVVANVRAFLAGQPANVVGS
ncbi:MAG: D-2-hydroxyacid dehydrogenase [Lentisphaerae bacterium]|jgi:glycerate dehydrogenase|nr:D-2-hydroxyacid dehydrogenase [Lentisphaerota bacterium]